MIAGKRIAIVGAGIGGLATALRLSQGGADVSVYDLHDAPGGKIRTLPSAAGPVDAGPTVLTMLPVFEALFRDVGADIHNHVTLTQLHTLARHFWDDGTVLDLTADRDENIANIRDTFGAQDAAQFDAFDARAQMLFDAFDAPMMQYAAPKTPQMVATVLKNPRLIAAMSPHRTLASTLRQSFASPQLQQLFGRYATYVGGSPYQSPAILSLIWSAEARGVWSVKGGIHTLAKAIAKLAESFGATFHYNTPIRRIIQQNGRAAGLQTDAGQIEADIVVFNGDPRALVQGDLGHAASNAVGADGTDPRSLSAYVHAFAAAPSGVELSHHNVFFGHDPKAEFDALQQGRHPTDATLYVCAQDHGNLASDAQQRFEIIMNGPPVGIDAGEEKDPCQTQTFNRLRNFGLHFDRRPEPATLTTPAGFNALFPASLGSLYGRSPQGLMAGMKRPLARTDMAGLYLTGGGAHPGAGIPMATLSARHAVEAIKADLSSTSTSRQTGMRGGMSTGSAAAAPKRSPS